MPFKPIQAMTKKPDALTKTEPEDETVKNSLKPQTHAEIVASTTERIRIIYDDSGSMYTEVIADKQVKSCIALAAEAAEDFMKNCTPHVTAVEIEPLNEEKLHLTKNLPRLAAETKKIEASGGTPLYQHLEKIIIDQPISKFTHVVVFTDGQPTDSCPEGLLERLVELNVPIDIILIGDYDKQNLEGAHPFLETIAEKTKGYFLICKDGKAFREKLKYFAPTMRWMLPQIASKGN